MAQLVEHHLAKVRVAGSNPVVRSREVDRLRGLRSQSHVSARRPVGWWMLCGVVAAALSLAACGGEPAHDAVVAAASDTRDAFGAVAKVLNEREGIDIGFVFGSSGLLREQVINGAPFDVYVSANLAFVDEVIAAGAGLGESQRAFAVGRLALIAAPGIALPSDLATIDDFSRLVIANPAHAPYGVAAREALTRLDLLGTIGRRLIFADNVADAVRIVDAGEADFGIVALSLVISREHRELPTSLHEPIRQSLVVTTRGANNPAAARFVQFLQSSDGTSILRRFGFTVDAP